MTVRPGKERRARAVKFTRAGKPSGLKNPSRSMRSLGGLTLAMEAIVLLLAIQPVRMLQGGITTWQAGVLLGAAVAAVLLTGLLRKPVGWWLALGLQAFLIAAGVLLHFAIGAVGVIFGLVWLYVMHVRRHVLL
jgi:hypothetical protein